jgi:hypothetical protein
MLPTTDRTTTELETEAQAFRAAIGQWVKSYAACRSAAPAVSLGAELAQADLRRWSGRYFNAQAEAAALAAILSGSRLPEARTRRPHVN